MSGGLDGPIWLIGCGNMAGAMLRRWLDTGVEPARFTVVRPSGEPVADGVRVVTVPPDEPPPALMLLGFKPQQLAAIAPTLLGASRGALVVSILAGVTLARLTKGLPFASAIVRAMPNVPVAIGRGVVALHGDARQPEVEELMRPLGLVEWIADEGQFDAVTALAGSGPAFTYRFIDSLAAAAEQLGLEADRALRLARATVAGAAMTAEASLERPAILAERVASKGGSTRKGLDVLDDDGALARLLERTLRATERRNRELGG